MGEVGVIFNGFMFAQSGIGTAARGYVQALHSAGFDLSLINRDPSKAVTIPHALSQSLLNRRIVPKAFICHTEIGDVETLAPLFSDLTLITTWETSSLSAVQISLLERVRSIWVPSEFNAKVFRAALSTPVSVVPHVAVDSGVRHKANCIRQDLCIPEDAFLVLSVFTWQTRKNPLGIIEAFAKAFAFEENAFLVIKTSFCFVDKEQALQAFYAHVRTLVPRAYEHVVARIKLVTEFWDEAAMKDLTHEADCYLSLHRGEGWCYPLFDAVCAGIPCVATNYSGPCDYLSGKGHGLVQYNLSAAYHFDYEKQFYFCSDTQWASPNLEHAAKLLLSVFRQQETWRKAAGRWACNITERFSARRVGELAHRALCGSR